MVFVQLDREIDEEGSGSVFVMGYPVEKQAQWWLIVGDPVVNQSFMVKRMRLGIRVLW